MITGKIGYMKTMWKWLTQNEWEVIEEQMSYESEIPVSYGEYGAAQADGRTVCRVRRDYRGKNIYES